jgi:hypothetical protein
MLQALHIFLLNSRLFIFNYLSREKYIDKCYIMFIFNYLSRKKYIRQALHFF